LPRHRPRTAPLNNLGPFQSLKIETLRQQEDAGDEVGAAADDGWWLPTTGSGRFPVRGYASVLRRIVDDQGERTPERFAGDVQLHRGIRWH
jgi:hypothetical protein